MRYQLVLQWSESSQIDYDKMIKIENALIDIFDDEHEVDGHDEGSGEMNIFILTDDPKKVFSLAKPVLVKNVVWACIRIAYREVSSKNYTVLWPENLAEFTVA